MSRPPELTEFDLERVAKRVGPRNGESQAADATDLAELLESSQPPRDDRRWVYRPDERIRVLQVLFLRDGSPWIARFSLLLTASVVIGTLGLANDQPAAVIAAMVVAPLMSPVLGIAAALTLGLIRHGLRLTVVVALASACAILLAWAISASLVVNEITAEELSRTEPRLRDLVIALAAGAAGMYSVVRKDLTTVVPGVAIAVALVPPLATVGITAELGEWSYARGALLLYSINVLAIVLAAVGVLLATDFIASPSLREPKVRVAAAVTTLLAVLVIIPVWQNSRRIDDDVVFEHQVQAALHNWTDTHPSHSVIDQYTDDDRVVVVIAGPTEPADLDVLRAGLATSAFPSPTLQVRWIPATSVEGPD